MPQTQPTEVAYEYLPSGHVGVWIQAAYGYASRSCAKRLQTTLAIVLVAFSRMPFHWIMPGGIIFIFFLFFIVVVALIIVGIIQEKKRREALQLIASQLGLSFSEAKDRSMASTYGFLNRLRAGENRYAYNVMRGTSPEGYHLVLFDYHYETTHTDSDGDRRTTHHYFSVFTLTMRKQFPELIRAIRIRKTAGKSDHCNW